MIAEEWKLRTISDVKKCQPKEELVIILDELDFSFTKQELAEICDAWLHGKSMDEIAKELKRIPDEILLALLHHHRSGKIQGLFAEVG